MNLSLPPDNSKLRWQGWKAVDERRLGRATRPGEQARRLSQRPRIALKCSRLQCLDPKGAKQKNEGGKNGRWLFKPPDSHSGGSERGCRRLGHCGSTAQCAVTRRQAAPAEIRTYEKEKRLTCPETRAQWANRNSKNVPWVWLEMGL